uniref:ATP synthase subunit a n=1 Tax=Cardiochiles fuscipennis TaxID=69312 RepID=A0A0A6ZL35_9HYME|nr:ATP synthase F0 subunit 6 [Cardiochiles fuscipennis]
MLNLFSIFDPSTNLLYFLNWMSSMLSMVLFPQIYWFFASRLTLLLNILFLSLWSEFYLIFKNKFNMNNMVYLMGLFIFIFFNNFMGLFPYIFTSTSHLVFSLSFSLTMWFALMIFGWSLNTNFMFTHLVPMGTPFMLIFFMVLIELLSSLIRPLTLSIRLVANMVAGHLLITLMGNFISNFLYLYYFIIIFQMLLLILEFMVSLIQAYVFTILMVLYFKDTN